MADINQEAEITVESLLKLTAALKKTSEHEAFALDIEKKVSQFSKEQLESHTKAAAALLKDNKTLKKLRHEEIITGKQAAEQLANELRQGNLYSKMMGKRYDKEGKLLESTHSLHKDWGGMQRSVSDLTGRGGFTGLLAVIGVSAAAFAFIANEMDKSLVGYQDLRAQGQSFGGSMLEMRIAASASAMSLEEFAAFTRDTSNAVRQFGVVRLGEMSKNARIAMRGVGQLGMTTEQTNKALTNYMEVEGVRSNFREMDDRKRTANFVKFVKSTDSMAKATGATRDALMSLQKSLSEDKTIISMLRGKSEEAGNAMLQVLSGISAVDKDVGSMMTTMVKDLGTYGNAVFNEGSALFSSMAPGAQEVIKQIENGQLKGAEAFEALSKMGASIDPEKMRIFVAQGIKGADALLALANSSDKFRVATDKARKADEDQAQMRPMTQLMTNFQDVGKTFMSVFEKIGIMLVQVFGPALDLVAGGLTILLGGITKLSEGLNWVIDWYQKLGDTTKNVVAVLALVAIGLALFNKKLLAQGIGSVVKGAGGGLLKGADALSGGRASNLVKSITDKVGSAKDKAKAIADKATTMKVDIRNAPLIVKLHQHSISAIDRIVKGRGKGRQRQAGERGTGRETGARRDGGAQRAGRGGGRGGRGMDFIKGIKPAQMLAAGAAMVAVAGSIWIFTKALENFEKISWESIGKGVVSMGALSLAAIAMGKVKAQMLQGALGMLAIGAATIPFAYAMNLMENVNWETVLMMPVAMAAIGAVAAIMGLAAPLLITGAVVMGALGLALIPFAYALQLAQDPMIAFADSFGKLADIDGSSLFGTAAGITAVGVSLAAFGAAAAGGGVLSAIGNLFGGDPAEKMKAFADMGPALEKAGEGMKALSAANPEHIKALAASIAIFGEKVGEYSVSIGTVEQTQNIVNALESSVRLQAETINTEAPAAEPPGMSIEELNKNLLAALTAQTDAIIGTGMQVKKSVDDGARKIGKPEYANRG